MTNFQSFGLPIQLMQSLERIGFSNPTEVQAASIPLAMQGRDILGSAQTGTGKTGAFSIPLIAKLMNNPQSAGLILTPTRELALQVISFIHQLLGKQSIIKTALLIGGESMQKQLQQLKSRPRIIVSTPGRLNDHLSRGSVKLNQTDYLVLDEIDRMLDMGFSIQIQEIAKYLPAKRQTLMFTATLPANIIKLSEKYLSNPELIEIKANTVEATKIQQEVIHLHETKKYEQLVAQLTERQGSIIVFVKTKRNAEQLTIKLRDEKHNVDVVHGDLRQERRKRVINSFRNKKYRIMVATDIAARGLDIPHIEHVINYDLPQCPEDYIHRIGRTARAGAEGSALCFVTPADHKKWQAIERIMDPSKKPESYPRFGASKKDDKRSSSPKRNRFGNSSRNGSNNRNSSPSQWQQNRKPRRNPAKKHVA